MPAYTVIVICLYALLYIARASNQNNTSSDSIQTQGVGDFVAQGIGLTTASATAPNGDSVSSAFRGDNSTTTIRSTSTSAGSTRPATLTGAVASGFRNSSQPPITSASTLNKTNSTQQAIYPTITASGNASLWSCYSQWATYDALSKSWYAQFVTSNGCNATTRKLSSLSFETYTFTSYGVATYKLCDGVPRASLTGAVSLTQTTESVIESFSTGVSTRFITIEKTIYASPVVTELKISTSTATISQLVAESCAFPTTTTNLYPGLEPACSISPADCMGLVLTYRSKLGVASQTTSGFPMERSPHCNYGSSNFFTAPCTIYIPNVQLLYWPVSVTGEPCEGSLTTITPTATAPVTAVVYNQTLTSNANVYLSYPGITAMANLPTSDSAYWSTTLPGGFLTMLSRDLSSYRGHNPGMLLGNTYPFNFADLPPNHVPVDAWFGMEECFTHGMYPECKTISEDRYAPNLIYPTQFRDFHPRFKTCAFDNEGLFDPPSTLAPAARLTDDLPPTKGAATKAPQPAANTPQPAFPDQTTAAANSPVSQNSAVPEPGPQPTGLQPDPPAANPSVTTIAFSSPADSSNVNGNAGSGSRPTLLANNGNADPGSGSTKNGGSSNIGSGNSDGTQQSGSDGGLFQDPKTGSIVGPVASGVTANNPAAVSNGVVGGIPTPQYAPQGAKDTTQVVTFGMGRQTFTASSIARSGSAGIILIESVTLTPGGAAQTLSNGAIVSAGTAGLVMSAPHSARANGTTGTASVSGAASSNRTGANTASATSANDPLTTRASDPPSSSLSRPAPTSKKSSSAACRPSSTLLSATLAALCLLLLR